MATTQNTWIGENMNAIAAKCIRIVGWIVRLVIMWQAVRFCQGLIGAPGFDQVIFEINKVFGRGIGPLPIPKTETVVELIFAYLNMLAYYMGGISTWFFICAVVSSLFSAIARIVEVGFKPYLAECKEAREDARRLEKIAVARERRQELRRKRIEAQQPKSSLGFGALLIGIVIGKIL